VIVSELISKSEVPVFFMVTGLAAEVAPTFTDPKPSLLGVTEILGGGTWPESFTETVGFFGSSDEIFSIALFLENGVVGLKLIVRAQVPPGVIASGQLPVGLTSNSDAFAPERLIDETVRFDLPEFPMVRVLGDETPPAFTEPKFNDVGFTEILGGASALDGPADKKMLRVMARVRSVSQIICLR